MLSKKWILMSLNNCQQHIGDIRVPLRMNRFQQDMEGMRLIHSLMSESQEGTVNRKPNRLYRFQEDIGNINRRQPMRKYQGDIGNRKLLLVVHVYQQSIVSKK